MPTDPRARIEELPIWSGSLDVEPLSGGLSNESFVVRDVRDRYVVRFGEDVPAHHVNREREVAVSRAAFLAGLAPEVIHVAPGLMVMRFVEGGRPLTSADVREPATLARIAAILRRCHRDVPRHLRGAAPFFWVFHVLRDYTAALLAAGSPFAADLPRLAAAAERLEALVGPTEIVFGHNDLLPANILDDGERLWLIDWEYAGYGSPLFDLSGLASNNELTADEEATLLEAYFERPPDESLLRRFDAMKCASLLREAVWGMVSAIHLTRPVDYIAYARDNLARFDRSLTALHSR